MLSKIASASLVLFQVGTSSAVDYVPNIAENCRIHGDPHIQAFGTSNSYSLQETGNFHYVYELGGNLGIQGHEVECGDRVSCVDAVAVQFCGHRFISNLTEPEWSVIGSANQNGNTEVLPNGFNVSSWTRYRIHILTLPDGSKIQTYKRSNRLDVTIQLGCKGDTNGIDGSKYNAKVKGQCGLKGTPMTFTATYPRKVLSTDYYVNTTDNNNAVTSNNCISCKDNNDDLPPLVDLATYTPPFTCPNAGTPPPGNEKLPIVTTGSFVEDPVILPPVINDPVDLNHCIATCRAAAEKTLNNYPSCKIDAFKDEINDCATDMLNIQEDTATLLTSIKDQCTPTVHKCRLRHRA